jgi:hypothetical protein
MWLDTGGILIEDVEYKKFSQKVPRRESVNLPIMLHHV